MYSNKVLFIFSLSLTIAACSSSESPSPITTTPTSTLTSTPTIITTNTATLAVPTDTPIPTDTRSPEIVEIRAEVTYHVAQDGDTLLGIAEKYNLSPESILYSNFEIKPHTLESGKNLVIPPIDGFYYTWKEGEMLPVVAHRFGVSIISILTWSENGLDRELKEIEPGTIIFIPGGKNFSFDWNPPTAPVVTGTPSAK